MRGAVVAVLIVLAVLALSGQGIGILKYTPVSVVSDWTQKHVILPQSESINAMINVSRDPRYWQQRWSRYAVMAARLALQGAAGLNRRAGGRDWSISLATGTAGPQNTYPAKFTFDVTAAPSCTADFVVTGINVAGSATQANIVGLNNLYNGSCTGTVPAFMFAYNVGPGAVYASVVMSLDGKKLAFTENNGASTYFHVLTYGTTGTNGTDAAHPVVPGAAGGNNAVDTKVLLPEGTTTAPFVDYTNDIAYLTTYDSGVTTGTVRKITGVFRGTPTQVTTSGWPIASSTPLSTPVRDSVSQRLFFRNSAGQVRYVDTAAATGAIAAPFFTLTSGADGPARPPIVDSTNGMIYAYSSGGSGAGTYCVVGQANINLDSTSWVTVNVGSVTALTAFTPDLNNAYYAGNLANAYLYAVGNDGTSSLRPTLYRIGFGTGWRLNSTRESAHLHLTATGGGTGGASTSPLTEFYNPTLAKDFLFVGITDHCSTGVTGGCARSLDITNGLPASANTVILGATGGTSGITVDNISAQPGAASVYYLTLGLNGTGYNLVKATQAGLL
ncbi:MAG: hypothetical protein ABSD56_02030 [Bryobacteraceae bacterium]